MPIRQSSGRWRLHLVCAAASHELAAPLVRALEAAGFIISGPDPGDDTDAAETANLVVVAWTPAGAASDMAALAASRARRARKLFPLMLAPCSPPAGLSSGYGAISLSGWTGDPADRDFHVLVDALHARLSGRFLSGEFWRSQAVSWGGISALAVAVVALTANFGGLLQMVGGAMNPAASERSLEKLEAKVDAVFERFVSTGADLQPGAESAMRDSIARLLSAQDGARGRAAQKLEIGDVDGALGDLNVAAAEGELAAAALAETWKEIGALAFATRSWDAIAAYRRATQLSPNDGVAKAMLGDLLLRTGQLDEAEQVYSDMLDGELGEEDKWVAAAATGLGRVALTRFHLEEAEEWFIMARETSELAGDKASEAYLLADLGAVDLLKGNLQAAERMLRRSLTLHLQAGDPVGTARTHLRLGNLALEKGDLSAARESYTLARDMRRQLGDIEGEARALGGLGDTALKLGETAEARAFYLESLELARTVSAIEVEAVTLIRLGEMALEDGDQENGVDNLREAMFIYLMMGLYDDALALANTLEETGAELFPDWEEPEAEN